jgi:dTDP-4-amino-4,6-dideoxygalactose transaminase|tara:strand:+ start:23665 stop:24342 length:678 start_codon:yes stop_codon:yes gene_type:complete
MENYIKMYEAIEKVIPILEKEGYKINDPWDVVEAFEAKVAEYAGSKYAVACDSCTNAMFLSLKYLNASGKITIPSKTYLSVPGLILHAGCDIDFIDQDWSGTYRLDPYPVIDGATRFTKGMYIPGTLHCLSFHIRKILPIAKGGMILTDDKEAVEWLKLAEYEGRDRRVLHDEMPEPTINGWNMYMPPEQAARGILLFNELAENNDDCGGSWKYKDLSSYKIWRK